MYGSGASGSGGGFAASGGGGRGGGSDSGGTGGGSPALPETRAIPFVREVVAAPDPHSQPNSQAIQLQRCRNMWNGWCAVPLPRAATQVSPVPGMMRWNDRFLMLNMITVRGKSSRPIVFFFLQAHACLSVVLFFYPRVVSFETRPIRIG